MLDHIRYSREDIASEDLRPTELVLAMVSRWFHSLDRSWLIPLGLPY